MKLSQSEDQNLRELKIALSSTLPSANKINNSDVNKNQIVDKLKSSTVTQSCTSSSSISSKADKISFSLSTSSTSDALQKSRQLQNVVANADMRVKTNETAKIEEAECDGEGYHQMITDNKIASEDNKSCEGDTENSEPNVNNNINSNGNKGKRKIPAIDLDRNDGVSV